MSQRRTRIALMAILALFLLPLVLAWLAFTGTLDLAPARTDNQGWLVIPPQPLPWNAVRHEPPPEGPTSLAGAWIMLFPVPDPCETACWERVRMLRQVHRAAGREAERLRVAALLPAGPDTWLGPRLREINPEIHLLFGATGDFDATLHRAAQDVPQPSVYLVDPLGNVMMAYEAGDSMNKLRKDLKKLLTFSKLDEQP